MGGNLQLSEYDRSDDGVEAEIILLRRVMGGALKIGGELKSPRRIESYWVLLETVWATLREESVTQKQLVAASHGVWSQATISRVIADLERGGFIERDSSPDNNRLQRLNATHLAIQFIMGRSKVTRFIVGHLS